ncbi:sulfurtransferase TusA family protein [Basilea psittacipulmonis]|uniref:Oxidoreductase n=1 Tax=Basilea psittacipulmonis DSM 24701 TaxID=1072685 RepID=A0A077DFY3_9BURK|nr:sulfurtransferase TusA family protein [Basilea psittacipulmonis]AIL32307.1 oxidoreductase [Basilea psittacipulmonis DSM 24701]
MDLKLNTVGNVCPFPLVEAKNAMNQLNTGDQLIIEFDCTQATDSIPQWAADEGYEVKDFAQIDPAKWTITVVKK